MLVANNVENAEELLAMFLDEFAKLAVTWQR